MLAYGWFLAPPRGAQSGPLALTGYGNYGTASAIGMALAVLLSAIGTHRFVVSRAPPPVPRQSFAQTIAAVRETLSNRAFLVLMLSGVLIYTAQGVSFSLANYLLGFVWLLTTGQFLLYSLALFAGVVLAFIIVTPVGRVLGKPRAAFVLSVVTATLVTAPYALRLAGLFPPMGNAAYLPLYLGLSTLSTAITISTFVTGASMMSDVVEAAEEKTGRREEGLFFAGALFMQKCSSGLGIMLTGTLLGLAQFPNPALQGQVELAILDRLMILFCAVYFGLAMLSALVVLRFPFGHAEHQARLAKLAVAAGGNA